MLCVSLFLMISAALVHRPRRTRSNTNHRCSLVCCLQSLLTKPKDTEASTKVKVSEKLEQALRAICDEWGRGRGQLAASKRLFLFFWETLFYSSKSKRKSKPCGGEKLWNRAVWESFTPPWSVASHLWPQSHRASFYWLGYWHIQCNPMDCYAQNRAQSSVAVTSIMTNTCISVTCISGNIVC